jgi:hypothetical protein
MIRTANAVDSKIQTSLKIHTKPSKKKSVPSFHISVLFAQLHSLCYLYGSIFTSKANLNKLYSKKK